MTQVINRFTDMFAKTGVTERKPKAKKSIDFGASLDGDDAINATFLSLHSDPANSAHTVNLTQKSPAHKQEIPQDAVSLDDAINFQKQHINHSITSHAAHEVSSISNHELSDRQTLRVSNGLTVAPLYHQTDSQLGSMTDGRSNRQTVPQLDAHTGAPSDNQTVRHTKHQTVSQYQTSYQTPVQYIPLTVLNLAYNQACVLENLIGNTAGITNYRSISDQTHIGIPSVRQALSRLIDKGFMHKPVTIKNAAFQGFSFILNKGLCDHFLSAGGLSQETYTNYQTQPQTVRQSDSVTVQQFSGQTIHSSSKSLTNLNTTTTQERHTVESSNAHTVKPCAIDNSIPSDIDTVRRSDGFILVGAIGAYWEEEGLTEGQAKKWCQQFEVNPEHIKQQLEWARFDLEHNSRRKEVQKDVISWFFGHLRKTGGSFPRPVNYKSPAEIRAEFIEKDLAQEQEAKARLAEAERELSFQKILADKESVEYQKLLFQVNKFSQDMGGQVLEIALRDVFNGSSI